MKKTVQNGNILVWLFQIRLCKVLRETFSIAHQVDNGKLVDRYNFQTIVKRSHKMPQNFVSQRNNYERLPQAIFVTLSNRSNFCTNY